MTTRPPLAAPAVALLACPVCGSALTPDDAGVRCTVGHAVDRARQGQLSLRAPGRPPVSGDSAQMVADRVEFLAAGHYAGLTRALGDAVLVDGTPASLLDVGGGTGHHLAAVLDRAPGAAGVVLDSSVYAARRAARAHPAAVAVVADTWGRWPVRTGALDRVLVVFAPRHGAETARVLRPEGRLVVVTPAADHLEELVGPLGLLTVDPAKAERLHAALDPHLVAHRRTEHRERLILDHAAVRALVGMGPHARHVAPDRLAAAVSALPVAVPVTLSVEIGTYARRA